jgi:hypothetical protein
MFVRLGKFLLAVILALLAFMLPQSTTLGQAAQAKTQRFGAGWIDIPAGYKFEHVVGPDFDVDYVIPNDVQLNKATTMLGLYTGFAPPFNPPAKGVKIRAGHFGARKIKWHIWKTVAENETVYHFEALIRLKGGLWVWHLFMAAPDMQRMRELMSILESYRAM